MYKNLRVLIRVFVNSLLPVSAHKYVCHLYSFFSTDSTTCREKFGTENLTVLLRFYYTISKCIAYPLKLASEKITRTRVPIVMYKKITEYVDKTILFKSAMQCSRPPIMNMNRDETGTLSGPDFFPTVRQPYL